MDQWTQQYITWAIAILGLLGGAIGFVRSGLANKKARAADELATKASLDAAAAQKDIAAALGQMVAAPDPIVRWRLSQVGENKWSLINEGNILARSVTLGGVPNEASGHLMAAEHPDLEPGESYSFFISRTMGGPQIQSLKVVWLDQTADHGLEKTIRVDW